MINQISAPFRITVAEASDALMLRIEGKVSGPTAEELRQTWSTLSSKLGNRALVIDLRNALYIDANGLAVLAEIHRKTDAKFQADSPLTQYFAEQATKVRNLHENSKRSIRK
ncbi:MAG TPA: STAS domain-containing protein [Candidatus Aquilonibacter sp.]|nr:STAS domain-containing protein [Candidatus Aquilonibacter sp.]